ncbi:hypothetical protein CA984_07740 [Streptosporangium minutum]|uniref:Uncharacterized protein n=1 Tax=Streptosporangium minutum TaxID=569862 RepID=A0A243RTE8_9ACTN|nr:hypothetical protein CA984_07740 [Streptosporangium minutum]
MACARDACPWPGGRPGGGFMGGSPAGRRSGPAYGGARGSPGEPVCRSSSVKVPNGCTVRDMRASRRYGSSLTRCGPNRWISRAVLRRGGADCPAISLERHRVRRARRPHGCALGEREGCRGD